MINWVIIYGILMGLALRALNHGRLVVPGEPSRPLHLRLLGTWVQLMIITFIIVQGFGLHGLYPSDYQEWWDSYFLEHSPMAFVLVTLPITGALYLMKVITFIVHKDPHGFQFYDPGTGAPALLRTSMRTPMIWYLIYWAWILFSPWLPFYQCFVRGYW